MENQNKMFKMNFTIPIKNFHKGQLLMNNQTLSSSYSTLHLPGLSRGFIYFKAPTRSFFASLLLVGWSGGCWRNVWKMWKWTAVMHIELKNRRMNSSLLCTCACFNELLHILPTPNTKKEKNMNMRHICGVCIV